MTQVPEAPSLSGLDLTDSSSFKRKNNKPAHEDLNLVAPNIYIGCLESAKNVDLLKTLNITHILTVEDKLLEEDVHKHFTYKFKRLLDLPSSNILDILEECIEFIDSGVNNSTGVLIHCLVGISRSAAIVIGYLMNREKRPLEETLELVRKNRYVRPNMGFQRQLEFFEAIDFRIVKDRSTFRAFKLEKMADMIQMGGRFDELFISSEDVSDDKVACYKCKKCRTKLFNVLQTVEHIKGYENSGGADWKYKFQFYARKDTRGLNSGIICDEEIFVEPLSWFQTKLSDLNGKINCPKCEAKLGAFDWCGSKCACGCWVTPAFHIAKSKVDLCKLF